MAIATGVYCRISQDSNKTGLGVERQLKSCIELADQLEWTVAKVYKENDVSASKTKPRPLYQQMLADVRAGVIDSIVVFDIDRLTRRPRELEDIVDLNASHGLQVKSAGGDIDLATVQGRMTARIKGSVARAETEGMGRRIRAKAQELAEAGKPTGPVRYGWTRVHEYNTSGSRIGFHDELHPQQAPIVAECAARLLAGESLRAIAADLNARGVPTMRAESWAEKYPDRSLTGWRSANLRKLLLRPGNAGQRVHQGKVIGAANWPAILDGDTYDRVVALLSDPVRKSTAAGTARVHLLSGIARCGREDCDGLVGVTKHSSGRTIYQCRKCWGSNRAQIPTDDLVELKMIAKLEAPDALDVLLSGDAAAEQRAREEIAAVTAKLALVADQYADDELSPEQFARINAKLRPRIVAAQAIIDASMPANLPTGVAGPEAAQKWQALPLDGKRALIEALAVVTLLPIGAGKRFDPALVSIEFASAR